MKDAPKDVIVRIDHGRLLMAQGKIQDAIILLEKVVKDAADSRAGPLLSWYVSLAEWRPRASPQRAAGGARNLSRDGPSLCKSRSFEPLSRRMLLSPTLCPGVGTKVSS